MIHLTIKTFALSFALSIAACGFSMNKPEIKQNPHPKMRYELTLGPPFILCLIFDQTKDIFRRWLMYGVGTMFAMAMLSVVSAMVLDLTAKVSEALWASKVLNSIIGNDAEGLTSLAMQQVGIGLLMTVLVISVPPMAAVFFNGTMGQFMHFSAFGGGALSRPGPQGQPAGSYGGGYVPPKNVAHSDTNFDKAPNSFNDSSIHTQRTLAKTKDAIDQDTVKYKPRDGG